MTRSLSLLRSVLPLMLMNAVAEGSTGGGAVGEAAAAPAPAAAEAETSKRAPAANFLPIVRGRLPLLFVHAVRFDAVMSAMGNKDLGTKLGTSVGKIFDIKKGRNFGYVNKDWKPSAEDISAAKAWAEQVGAENAKGLTALGDKKMLADLIDGYEKAGLATAEQLAAQSAARTKAAPGANSGAEATPGAAAAPKAGKAAKAPKTEQVAAAGSADDLLK